ncbi:hypothetical protein BHF71_02715 [Vulcanibacillus modesticaldus]|uniref:Uncharacterized protein n=1 Tax=Vulcanibacillus modesticaldus TaxID=337097 RepID=A0A1D2YT63_9BACI|nr:hypothetical protein [Vulcanibacillus modesticaldus]OEF98856.1 hypothetical protein BHF71_02715 [Vulcanibacillus modesticaldus]
MSVSFVIGKGIESAEYAEDAIEFSEEIQQFLSKNRDIFSKDISKLVDIDPYADTCITSDDVLVIRDIAISIKNDIAAKESNSSDMIDEVIEFTTELIDFCNEAMEKGLNLIAVGD